MLNRMTAAVPLPRLVLLSTSSSSLKRNVPWCHKNGSGARRLLLTHTKNTATEGVSPQEMFQETRTFPQTTRTLPHENAQFPIRCFHALRRQTKKLSQRMAYRHRDRQNDRCLGKFFGNGVDVAQTMGGTLSRQQQLALSTVP